MQYNSSFTIEYNDKLTPLESAFKDLYLRFPDNYPQTPTPSENISNFFSWISPELRDDINFFHSSSFLSEEAFIPDRTDVSIHRHDRYSPAFIHSHDFIELICVLRGDCINYVGSEQFKLAKGDLCIIAPSADHTICSFSDTDVIYNILIRTSTFQTAFFNVLSEDNILSDFFLHLLYQSPTSPHLLFHTDADDDFYRYIGLIYSEFEANQRYCNRMLVNLVSSFFIYLLRNHSSDVQLSHHALQEQNVVYILRYLQMHYQTITLTELSRFFGYSTRQMQRLLLAATGLNFRNNVLKLKMTEAEKLLIDTSLSLETISSRLGYTTPESFRHTFKHYHGVTPSDYRKQHLI